MAGDTKTEEVVLEDLGALPDPATAASEQQQASGDENQALFSLQEYDFAQHLFVYEGVRKLMEAQDPFYASIKKVTYEGVPSATHNTLDNGQVVSHAPVSVMNEYTMTFDQIASGDNGFLAEQMNTAAENSLKIVMTGMFEIIAKTSKAVGNSVDAGGRSINHDLILDCIDSVEFSFDENGEPKMPTMVVHPETAKSLKSLPARTAEQEQRYLDIIKKKRTEHNARQRHRKLH